MRHLIVLSGNLTDGPLLTQLLLPRNYLVAADGGSDHLHRLNILPDLVVGDFDSIAADGREWIESNRIPVHRFPTVKDTTDSEIALEASLSAIPRHTRPQDVELVFLGALGSRPDHVLGNQMMAAALAQKGYRVTMSDGVSLIYAMSGPDRLNIDMSKLPQLRWVVSTIAISAEATGLTYTGLCYPLNRFTLPFGSSHGLSNEPGAQNNQISISLEKGTILVCLTPSD